MGNPYLLNARYILGRNVEFFVSKSNFKPEDMVEILKLNSVEEYYDFIRGNTLISPVQIFALAETFDIKDANELLEKPFDMELVYENETLQYRALDGKMSADGDDYDFVAPNEILDCFRYFHKLTEIPVSR